MFVSILRRKAVNAGGEVSEFSAYNALSQVCHCGLRKKKSLSMRWHICECGVYAQRDLYSAFLARFVQDNTLDTRQAKKSWPTVKPLLDRAVLRVKQSASGWLPSSFGQLWPALAYRDRADRMVKMDQTVSMSGMLYHAPA